MAMTNEKLQSAFNACERLINTEAQKHNVTMAIRDAEATTDQRRASHLLWMAREGMTLIKEHRREKAMRWLGFLQGALWALRLVSVEQLKDMNRPDESEHDSGRV